MPSDSSSSTKRGSSMTAGRAAAATGGGKEYVPLPLIGEIREKGFSPSESPSKHWQRISAPEPRATPFPVARHRSDGPHWAPPSQSVQIVSDAKEDQDDDNGEKLASNAQPLVRKKKTAVNFSKWKTEVGQKEVSNQVRGSETEGNSSCTQSNVSSLNVDKNNIEEDGMVAITRSIEKDVDAHVSNVEQNTQLVAVDPRAVSTSTVSSEYSLESTSRVEEDISSINEAGLESMTIEQIAEAQRELAERFRPDILDMLRRRGKKKAEKQINGEKNADTLLAKPDSPMPKEGKKNSQEQREDVGPRAQDLDIDAPPLITQESLGDQYAWGGRSWTQRVEAVRLFHFGLDGNVVSVYSASASPFTGDIDSQWRIPNVTERDFLRMEGDPSSHGYTIKEAVALARSMVPAQRSAALRLLGNILNKAMLSLQSRISDECLSWNHTSTESIDWQAVWAYALGPEPELVLTLRMALDDSHATAVVTCARALEFLLSSSPNEHYFNLYESLFPGESYMFTAPVFQKSLFKESGLIGDCYWKYNVKPMDMLPFSKNNKSQGEDTDATVKDDASVANQDVAAGLIRMGILPRIRYLLEVERLTSAEDSLFAILIALSRHSPAAADAVMKCPRLIDTIRQLLILDETLTWPVRPKAIRLLKVLSIASKVNCIKLLNLGIFESSQLGLLRQGLTLGKLKVKQEGSSWVELVESLDFWRICINYGLCISRFSDFYPALLFWITTPLVWQPIEETLDAKDAIVAEVSFRVLEALAGTLPTLHGKEEVDLSSLNTSPNFWSWKFAIPVVENSLGWLSFDFVHTFTESSLWRGDGHTPFELGIGKCLQIMSSVLHFLSMVCERILEEGSSGPLWLPTFVPKLGLLLVKSGLLGFKNFDSDSTSLIQCFLGSKGRASGEYLLKARNCIRGLVRLLKVLDRLLTSVKVDQGSNGTCETDKLHSGTEEILKCGLILSAKEELMQLLRVTGNDLVEKSGVLNMVDNSRRGGPAPGIGIGWGCKGGGHWSHEVLAAQIDSTLVLELMDLLNVSEPSIHYPTESWKIKVGFSVSLLAGPCRKNLVERICSAIILNESSLLFYLRKIGPLLKKWFSKLEKDTDSQEIENHLDNLCLRVEDIRHTLLQHVKHVWLCQKSKSGVEGGFIDEKHARGSKNSKWDSALSTIPENSARISTTYDRESLAVEWAGQKLPLPSFWFWSPLLSNKNLSMGHDTDESRCSVSGLTNSDIGEVMKYGLLLLFGLEALEEYSPPFGFKVPVARKIHALSSIFVLSDDAFLEKSMSTMVGALQEMYMHQLDSTSAEGNETMEEIDTTEQYVPSRSAKKDAIQMLDFEAWVDERYLSFLDRLTSQFASVSYGDLVFSRQVAIYLRRDVSESLRLRVWKSLESEHMLEFLPPLEKCCGPSTMYIYPKEESQELLKAYASAWAGGALDRAIACQSLSFSLAVSHVASYIFDKTDGEQMLAARKTFAKSFLLQLARRPLFQESLLRLLNCKVPVEPIPYGIEGTFRSPSSDEKKMRYILLEEACAQYSHLVDRIQQLCHTHASAT